MSDIAKKILSKAEFNESKMPDYKKTIKGTDKIDTNQVEKMTKISEFQQRQLDRSNLNKIKEAVKKLKDAGETSRAKDLIQKAMQSKAFKRIASEAGKKTLKALPLVGGIASAVMSNDASAAIPIVNEAEDIGPEKGSLEAQMEDPSLTAEQRFKIQQKLKEKFKTNLTK